MNDFTPYASEHEAIEAYKDMLDECHETVRIGDLSYDPSRVLEAVDPIAFRCGFNDWLDSVREDMDADRCWESLNDAEETDRESIEEDDEE